MASRRRILDVLQEHFPDISPKELCAAVMCGEIKINGHTVRDPSAEIDSHAAVSRTVRDFVSRGGRKLDFALSTWDITVAGMVLLDAGSSTGGFTDCLLQHGASHVHAVDVGYNQLDWKLRRDPRVFVHERTNIMDMQSLDPPPAMAVADLSFRSLRGAARKILSLTMQNRCIALIKPQFEIGGRQEDFDGVVRDRNLLVSVVAGLLKDLLEEGVHTSKLVRSPITGAKGNIELLALFEGAETGNSDGIDAFLEDVLQD